MSEEVKDSQKTVVAFIAGLLVGGLLVWMFGGPAADTVPETEDEAVDSEILNESEMDFSSKIEEVSSESTTANESGLSVGAANARVAGASTRSMIALESATFPTDAGWVAVRSYNDGALGNVLGASRYSKEQGLIPDTVNLLTPTVAGNEYAIVFFSENGDRQFNMRSDFQLDVEPIVFTAK